MKLKKFNLNNSTEERRKIILNNRESIRCFYAVLVYVNKNKNLKKLVKIELDGKV